MLPSKQLEELFKGKRILITGHTGFKGAWLTYILQQFGAETIGYSISEPENLLHCYYALGVKDRLVNNRNFLYDIASREDLSQIVAEYQPEFIFHLAAQAIVSKSYQEPYSTILTNIVGTANVLEVIRLMRQPITAVIITSDKCYKNKERFEPYHEEEEMGGNDPYSASKGACELLFHSYLTSFFNDDPLKKVASVRAGNVFGGGDWSVNRLIPDCVRQLLSDRVVNIRMPEAIRPWTFVVDILYGYLMLAYFLYQDKTFQGSWNFASGETRTVLQVCEAFINALGLGQINIDTTTVIGKESGLLLIDESKARKKLGWNVMYDLDTALKLTADWYYAQHKGVDMSCYSADFLKEYLAKTEKS